MHTQSLKAAHGCDTNWDGELFRGMFGWGIFCGNVQAWNFQGKMSGATFRRRGMSVEFLGPHPGLQVST